MSTPLGDNVATQAFEVYGGSDVEGFMMAVYQTFTEPVYFQYECTEDKIRDLLWAIMTVEFWQAEGGKLQVLGRQHNLEPVEVN